MHLHRQSSLNKQTLFKAIRYTEEVPGWERGVTLQIRSSCRDCTGLLEKAHTLHKHHLSCKTAAIHGSLDHHGAAWLASVKGGLYFQYHSGCCHACINTVYCSQQVISLIFTSQIANTAHYQVRAGDPHSVHS